MAFRSVPRSGVVCLAVGVALCFAHNGMSADQSDAASPSTTQTAGGKYALLVGCTKYDEHSGWELQGPANDVQLMRNVLTKHFGFDDKNIVTLAEGGDADHRPTKANIKREFDELARSKAHSNDQVVILLSGHGAQQPEQESSDPEDHKLDGMDEIFLPADTGEWDDAQKSVTNVILDHEFRRWIDKITDTGAHVWAIIDSCHSGTMIRGTDAEKTRNVSPDSMLVPREAILSAREKAKKRAEDAIAAGAVVEWRPLALGHMQSRVGLYAAQAGETAPELPLPIDTKDAQPQGLLTYTLCEMLTPKSKEGRPSLTYRELGQRIRQRYAAMNRNAPTPLVEGGDLDREVLGLKEWPRRSRIELEKSAGQWQINAGTLLGLNKGSVLAVYDPNSASNKPAGHVKITEEGMASSTVTPCEYDGVAVNEQLPSINRCELVYVDLGSRPLKLAVDEYKPKASGPDLAAIERVRQLVEPLQHEKGSLIQLVANPQDAAWQVQLDGEKCYLVPGCGILEKGADATVENNRSKSVAKSQSGPSSDKSNETPRFGPYGENPSTLVSQLREALGRIARAQALINLAEQPIVECSRSSDAVAVEAEMLRFKDDSDKTGEIVRPGRGIELHDGDRIAFRIKNAGNRFMVYPSILFIDSGYGIKSIFPQDGEVVQALDPGKSITTGTLDVDAKTVGKEQIVAIAVKAAGQPADFSGFEQPTLERERGSGSTRGEALRTSIGELLEEALYREGGMRGIAPKKIGESAMAHLVWDTKPKPSNPQPTSSQ